MLMTLISVIGEFSALTRSTLFYSNGTYIGTIGNRIATASDTLLIDGEIWCLLYLMVNKKLAFMK